MRRQSKILKILAEKSGMSLMFVLGIMLMLMAIGVSTIAAASSNFGFVQNQTVHNRVMVLAESVQKNILYGLQNGEGDPNDTMSAQIIKAMCAAYVANEPDYMIPLVVSINDDDVDLSDVSIELSFPRQQVFLQDKMDPVDDKDGTIKPFEGVPMTATVNVTMAATVKISIKGKATMTSRATYEYTGGRLDVNDLAAIAFIGGEYGEWRLLAHEKVES